jgi:hypothetical protein
VWFCYETNIQYFSNVYGNETYQVKTLSEMASRSSPLNIDIFELEDKKRLKKTSVYNYVLTSFSKPFGNEHGRSTNVHETVHGINNALSNSRKGYRSFYCGTGRSVWLKEPNIKMTDITPNIPDVLKEYRYTLYFVSQLKYWEDVGLYPLDEWSAYISGAECAVDDYTQNMLSDKFKSDSVSGALEFSVYCTALAKTVKEKDTKYWNDYPEFKNTIYFFLVRAEKVFFEGRYIFPSERQELLLNILQNNSKAKPIRDFLIEEFDGIFIQ